MKKFITFVSTLILYFALLQIILGLGKHLKTNLIDFEIYHQYGRILLSGKSPYGKEYTQGIPFNYPPSSFLLFAPLSIFDLKTSQIIFTAISFFSLLIGSYLFLGLFTRSKPVKFFIIALLYQNFPTKFTLVTGQSNLIVLTFLLLSLLSSLKKREYQAGFYWALASMIKLTPLSLGVYFLFGKKYKSLVFGLTVFVISNLFILAINPGSDFYLKNHLPALLSLTGQVTTLYDQSLRTFFVRAGINRGKELSNILSVVLLSLAARQYLKAKLRLKMDRRHKNMTDLTIFSQILIVTTIGNAFAWQHHFVFLFPGFITALLSIFHIKRSKLTLKLNRNTILKGLLLLLSAILVGMHYKDIAHPPTNNPFLISHTLMGGIILYIFLNLLAI